MFPSSGNVRPLIKICGLTKAEDIAACVEAGADALGFNFYPQSKRFLPWEKAEALLQGVPAGVSRVAVLVNAPDDEVRRIAESGLIDCLQFHGSETPEAVSAWRDCGLPVIRAAAVRTPEEVAALAVWQADALLLDAWAPPGVWGGTGHTADWSLAAEAVRAFSSVPVFIAGGLKPDNVSEALRVTGAAGADVAGGVESAPGIKDAQMVRAFAEAARSARSAL